MPPHIVRQILEELEVAVPRDRNASFDPRIVHKGQRRIDGFDDKVISMSARGMSVREIRGHLTGLCPDLELHKGHDAAMKKEDTP